MSIVSASVLGMLLECRWPSVEMLLGGCAETDHDAVIGGASHLDLERLGVPSVLGLGRAVG